MPVERIALSAGLQSGLQSVQRAEDQSNRRQQALASGKRVNSVRDDAVAYLTARALTEKASDLASVKEQSSQGLSSVGAALAGTDGVNNLLTQLKGVALSAQSTTDPAERASLASQFNTVRGQIDSLVQDSTYLGANLLKSSTTLTVDNVTVAGQDVSTTSLGVAAAATNGTGFTDTNLAVSNTAIQSSISQIEAAVSQVRTVQSNLGTAVQTLTNQADFTGRLSAINSQAAQSATEADTNEEAAGLLASRTRQKLALASQTIARDQERSVLSLFR